MVKGIAVIMPCQAKNELPCSVIPHSARSIMMISSWNSRYACLLKLKISQNTHSKMKEECTNSVPVLGPSEIRANRGTARHSGGRAGCQNSFKIHVLGQNPK